MFSSLIRREQIEKSEMNLVFTLVSKTTQNRNPHEIKEKHETRVCPSTSLDYVKVSVFFIFKNEVVYKFVPVNLFF